MFALTASVSRAAVPPLQVPAAASAFARDVLEGLGRPLKSIDSRWLRDARGSALFERIARLDAYYPARNEQALLQRALPHVARACGRGALVLQIGSDGARQAETLLRALDAPLTRVVLDCSDGSGMPPPGTLPAGPRLAICPGATIDSLLPRDAMALLAQLGRALGRGALLAIGADATQDPALLLRAHDDAEGLNAAFDFNLLARIDRELDGDFEPAAFAHEVRWNAPAHRIEMHLVAQRALQVRVLGRRFGFDAGESLHTRHCHKHTLLTFRALARHAGWAHRDFWMDSVSCCALHLLEYVG